MVGGWGVQGGWVIVSVGGISTGSGGGGGIGGAAGDGMVLKVRRSIIVGHCQVGGWWWM